MLSAVGARGRLTWLLLLGCTAVGVMFMHTLGHQVSAHSHQDQSHHAAHPVGMVGVPAPTGDGPADCHGACHGPAVNGGQAPDHQHLAELCLAVIGGLALLLAARTRSRRTATLTRPPSAASLATALSRASPGRAFGLRLATVSVLRT